MFDGNDFRNAFITMFVVAGVVALGFGFIMGAFFTGC